ncbi:hypothetical protein GCM10010919_04000 [Alishewanella longhuensis]|uniref:Tetratricopeptide repeat protein n=1 Tax=Alishewanella longhuensis TaxID=1091037 RepID=A0ABQ3KVB6_9ALTE|nr:tetratricopeptide repeat protein [Alishewanella longhuensis]GHG60497.1 hypothetical protein GCM10010919_04000 [Alishewanella longhuensis]
MLFISLLMLLLSDTTAVATQSTPSADSYFSLQPDLPANAEVDALAEALRQAPTNANRLKLASLYIKGSKMPGFGDWFHYAESLLEQYKAAATDIDYVLLLSDIKQQQHHFTEALSLLDKIFQQQPQHLQASLMAARIYLAIAETDLAQKACNRLMAVDIFLFSVCSYEVVGRKGQWQTAYNALNTLYSRHSTLDDALTIWVRGILAEQAEQLRQDNVALTWLTPILEQAPTSLWLKWADLSLRTGNAALLYEKMTSFAFVETLEDGLMLRLAIAEQNLQLPAHFQTIIHERMALRLIRQDQDHAADLVHYFLTLAPDPKLAWHWANVNYESAKEPDDKKLLELSQQALLAMTKE